MYLTRIEVAKRDLEAVDTATKISQNELGYHALKKQRTFSRRATYGVVPRRGDLRLCEDQSDVEKPLSPRNTHWKADGTTSNGTSTTQSTTTISSRIALGTPGC